jgi:nicotinamide-nucleotide amidase
VEDLLDRAAGHIVEAAGEYLYAAEDISLAEHLARTLTDAGQTLATAESCTAGLIAAALTDVAGASDWYRRGWVTYSDEAKSDDLGVPAEMIVEYGAVSEPVVRAMAEGARRRAGSDWSLAVTGIAGPTGERPGKPIGLTFVACAGPEGVVVRRYLFGRSERRINRSRATAVALDLLRRMLAGLDPQQGGWASPRDS